mgnify:CR=1 FL=1
MNLILWIVAAVLALAFAAAGAMKLAKPRADLVSSGMGWAEDYSDAAVKGIGAIELLGAGAAEVSNGVLSKVASVRS